jgi:hypothetical protein
MLEYVGQPALAWWSCWRWKMSRDFERKTRTQENDMQRRAAMIHAYAQKDARFPGVSAVRRHRHPQLRALVDWSVLEVRMDVQINRARERTHAAHRWLYCSDHDNTQNLCKPSLRSRIRSHAVFQ